LLLCQLEERTRRSFSSDATGSIIPYPLVFGLFIFVSPSLSPFLRTRDFPRLLIAVEKIVFPFCFFFFFVCFLFVFRDV
jgi:hypothetical protein